jgi:NADPH-dependent curcumin reductase CurA
MTPTTFSQEIRFASRPHGWPTPDNFALVRVEVPTPSAGQVLVRNLFMSVDPYMRLRMNAGKSYAPPFEVGQTLQGSAIGQVVASEAADLAVGDIVSSFFGWREYFVARAAEVRKVDGSVRPLSAYLSVLGGIGLTAWVGLLLGEAKAGDLVFVSGAAGAVGSVAGQLAKLRGCRVVGSAGSAEKVAMLVNELGFDSAFNYKDGDLVGQLGAAAPDGIDLYFDNVGGAHLEAALSNMRDHGRIVACGTISTYNDATPAPGPNNLFQIVGRRLTIKGFIVTDWSDRAPEFMREVGPLLASGRLKMKETVVEGITNAPKAFVDLLRGTNVGKMIVKIA